MVCDSSNNKSGELQEVLPGLEESIRQLGHNALLATFRNGVPPEKVRELLRNSDLAAHADLIDLYSWHDGSSDVNVRRLGDMYFFPGVYFLSLSEALSNYRTFLANQRWRPGWLPLFADGGGDFIFIDLSATGDSELRRFYLEEVDSPTQYRDLCGMLMTIDAAYRDGVFFLDSEGYLEMDDEAYAQLAKRMNPSVEWWR